MNPKRLWAGLLITALVAIQAGTFMVHGDQGATNAKKITGSWIVTVSPTGAPFTFQGLLTFTDGGGVIASAQGDILLNAPPGVAAVATAGHGSWARTGPHEYSFTFRQIFYDADGDFQGGAKIRNVATMDSSGAVWTSQFQFEWFDADGNVIFAGDGTQHATRIEVEPLT